MSFAAGDGGPRELIGCNSTVVVEEAMMSWQCSRELGVTDDQCCVQYRDALQYIVQEDGLLDFYVLL